jgi:hypothetical protein
MLKIPLLGLLQRRCANCLNSREAIAALDMKEVEGRSILLNEVLPRGDRSFISEVMGKVINEVYRNEAYQHLCR